MIQLFDCKICLRSNLTNENVIQLKTCSHLFCKLCLRSYITNSEKVLNLKCPSCDFTIEEKCIEQVLDSHALDIYEQKKLNQIEIANKNTFHCLTIDCNGYCLTDEYPNEKKFTCAVCLKINCLLCHKTHLTESDCKNKINKSDSIEELINSGLIMRCPKCNILIEKEDKGCQAVRCFYCKLDICWLTKKPRWGPSGKGDTSEGCKCGLNGSKCHPSCHNCH